MKKMTRKELEAKLKESEETLAKVQLALAASMQNRLVYLGVSPDPKQETCTQYYAVPNTDILVGTCFTRTTYTPYYSGILRLYSVTPQAVRDRLAIAESEHWEYLNHAANHKEDATTDAIDPQTAAKLRRIGQAVEEQEPDARS